MKTTASADLQDGVTTGLVVTTVCPTCGDPKPKPDWTQPPFFADMNRTHLVVPMECANVDCGIGFVLEVELNKHAGEPT